MRQQGARTGKGLPTLLTHIGLLTSVDSFMYLEGARKGEGFPTLLTHIGFFSAVIFFMPTKRARRSECFPTLLTFIVRFSTGALSIVLTGWETPGIFLTVTSFRFLLSANCFFASEKVWKKWRCSQILCVYTILFHIPEWHTVCVLGEDEGRHSQINGQ